MSTASKPPIHGEAISEYGGTLRKLSDLKDHPEVKVGMVLREVNPDGTVRPFSDVVVAKITHTRNAWDHWTQWHLAKPSIQAVFDGRGLVNVQTTATDLSYMRIVLDEKGEPYMVQVVGE